MPFEITPIDDKNEPTHPPPPDPDLMQHAFVMDITSPKGHGKTTLLIRYLENYKDYFHRVYIFSPTVSNDPKWNYLFAQPKIVAKNKFLEKWLKTSHPDLLKRRETPLDKILTGSSEKEPDTSHPTSLRSLPIVTSHSRKLGVLPTQSQIVTRGAHRVLETPEGLFMNQNPDSMVVGYPKPMEERRVAIQGKAGPLNSIDKLKQAYFKKQHGTLRERKLPSDENVRDKKRKVEEPEESDEEDEKEGDVKTLFPRGKLSNNIVCSSSDPAVFEAICETQNDIIKALEKKFGKDAKFKADRILFILDDVVGTPLFKDNGYFMSWVTRHRHFSASVILVTQAYKKVPKTIRTNINGLVLFRMQNEKELECIYEEYPLNMKFDEWFHLYQSLTEEPYSFMFVNCTAQLGKQVFYKFEKCVATKTKKDFKGGDAPIQFEEIDRGFNHNS